MASRSASAPDLWQRAASLAARAHRHQMRKDGATPYIAHPARVALTLAAVFGETDPVVLAAALLHDVIEDTLVDCDEVREVCGAEVARIVSCLTKDRRLAEPSRQTEYERRLSKGPWQARLVKLADIHDNLMDSWSPESLENALDVAERFLELTKREARLKRGRAAVARLVRVHRR